MSAWSHKPFDNDEAEEFLDSLAGEDGIGVLQSTLTEINLRKLDDDECMRAVAACEVIAAIAGHPVTGLPSEIQAWLKEHRVQLTATLQKRAQRVAAAILNSSELASLWGESGNAKQWQRTMQSLISRLEKPVKAASALKFKPPSAAGKSTTSSNQAKRTASTPEERPLRSTATASTKGDVKPISLKEVSSLLKKKLGGGYAGKVHSNNHLHEISFSTSRRIPGIRDAERMATLPNVVSFTVGGQNLSSDQVRSLQILITGWSTLRELTATGTTGGLASWICQQSRSMPNLEELQLDYTDVADVDLKRLADCAGLKRLDLSSTQITTKGLESLTTIRSLQRITFCYCDQISVAAASKFSVMHEDAFTPIFLKHDEDLGIAPLAQDVKAHYLKQNARVNALFDKAKNARPNRFFDTTFVLGALPTVVPLSEIVAECRLEFLVIGSEGTGEAKGLSADDLKVLLTAWPELRKLRIGKIAGCESTLLTTLGGLQHLQTLEVLETPCGDAVLPIIGMLKKLVRVELRNTRITGAALHHLEKLPRLRWINLEKNKNLSRADALAFRRRLAGKAWVDFR